MNPYRHQKLQWRPRCLRRPPKDECEQEILLMNWVSPLERKQREWRLRINQCNSPIFYNSSYIDIIIIYLGYSWLKIIPGAPLISWEHCHSQRYLDDALVGIAQVHRTYMIQHALHLWTNRLRKQCWRNYVKGPIQMVVLNSNASIHMWTSEFWGIHMGVHRYIK